MHSDPVLVRQSFSALRKFVRDPAPKEVCELCSAELGDDHEHLFESSSQRLICCCRGCAILFGSQREGRFRGLPNRSEFLASVCITDAEWQSLEVPVDLVCISRSGPDGELTASYPGPFGAIESALDKGAWEALALVHPDLADLESQVEAFLVRRANGVREVYRVPITECRKLIGVLRRNWQGISGGTLVWEEVDRFFGRLRDEATAIQGKEAP